MCTANVWPAVAALVAGYALIALLLRVDAWRETSRRRRLMAESLDRYERAQNRWVESPVVDVERRA